MQEDGTASWPICMHPTCMRPEWFKRDDPPLQNMKTVTVPLNYVTFA